MWFERGHLVGAEEFHEFWLLLFSTTGVGGQVGQAVRMPVDVDDARAPGVAMAVPDRLDAAGDQAGDQRVGAGEALGRGTP